MKVNKNINLKIEFSDELLNYIEQEDVYLKKIKRFNKEVYNICKDLNFE